MKTIFAFSIGVVVALSGSAFGQASKNTPDFSERYGILTDKNIFVRNRPATRKPGTRDRSPTRPEAMHVLTGITLQEGRHMAFIEDTGARRTQGLLQGDSVAGGKLVEVTFDAVEFESNGKRVHIPIGRNLLGDVAAVPPSSSPTSGPTTAPSINVARPGQSSSNSSSTSNNANAVPAPPPLPNAPNLSREEQMRLRRQQQTGGR